MRKRDSTCIVVVPAGKATGTVDVTVEAKKSRARPPEADRYTYE